MATTKEKNAHGLYLFITKLLSPELDFSIQMMAKNKSLQSVSIKESHLW